MNSIKVGIHVRSLKDVGESLDKIVFNLHVVLKDYVPVACLETEKVSQDRVLGQVVTRQIMRTRRKRNEK